MFTVFRFVKIVSEMCVIKAKENNTIELFGNIRSAEKQKIHKAIKEYLRNFEKCENKFEYSTMAREVTV